MQIFFCTFIVIFIMLKQILQGYKSILSSVFKILFLLLLCTLTGAVFVLPLWYFASNLPETYTFFISAITAAVLIFLTVKKIKKTGIRPALFLFLKLLTIAGALALSVYLILSGKRFLTFAVILAALFIWGLISFVLKNGQSKQEESFSEE